MSGSVARRGNLSLDGTAGGTEARNAARVAPHKWPIFFAKPFRRFHDRQGPPDTLHATVSAGNAPVIEEYLADLVDCAAEVAGTRAEDRSTSYATLE